MAYKLKPETSAKIQFVKRGHRFTVNNALQYIYDVLNYQIEFLHRQTNSSKDFGASMSHLPEQDANSICQPCY